MDIVSPVAHSEACCEVMTEWPAMPPPEDSISQSFSFSSGSYIPSTTSTLVIPGHPSFSSEFSVLDINQVKAESGDFKISWKAMLAGERGSTPPSQFVPG